MVLAVRNRRQTEVLRGVLDGRHRLVRHDAVRRRIMATGVAADCRLRVLQQVRRQIGERDSTHRVRHGGSHLVSGVRNASCGMLQDASRALMLAQSRFIAVEDQLTAMESRVQAAEAEARAAKETLALVEEAIRRRLLCASSESSGRSSAVA